MKNKQNEKILKSLVRKQEKEWGKKFYLWSERGWWLQEIDKSLNSIREEDIKIIKRKIKKIDRTLIDYHCGKHVRSRKKISELLDYLTT